MKLQDRRGREIGDRELALAACRELLKALAQEPSRAELRRAAVLARFALAMKH